MEKTPHPPGQDALFAQALQLHQQGKGAEAAAHYLRVLEVDPDHFDANHLLGVFAYQSNDLQAAFDLIGRARTLRPDDARAAANFGLVLQAMGRIDDAVAVYHAALLAAPDHPSLLNNCAVALQLQRRFAESMPYLERLLQHDAHHAEALSNLAFAYGETGRPEEALRCADAALALQPAFVKALFNRGNALQMLNRLDEALGSYEQAIALDPQHADSHFAAGACHMLLGQFEQGWAQFEWRWRKSTCPPAPPQFAGPSWRGEASLTGKTIVLYAEQGLGDTIQFCRYASVLAAQGASVVLQVPAPLVGLLAQVDGVRQVVAQGEPLPPFDYHCPLLGLGYACRTMLDSIPAGAYLAADPARCAAWEARLGARRRRRVGIVWSGNPLHLNDAARSVGLAPFLKLASDAVQLVSLQKDMRTVDRLLLEQRQEILACGGQLGDFSDTAALVAQLDLVVCVDTSVAHLAAAMGKPTWILLPFAPDWRWMLERSDSPWYPSATLWRQGRAGDWESVIDAVAAALLAGA